MIFVEKPLIVHIFLRPPEGEVSSGGDICRAARSSRSALLAEAAGDAGSLPGISDEWPFSGRVGRGPA